MEPRAAEGEGFRREGAEICGQLGKTWFAIFGNQDLPVRAASLFENAVGKPCGVCHGVDLIAVHVPEEVVGEGVHWKQRSRC